MSFKILIVDDEENTLRGLKKTLVALGYHVVTANNGLEGIEIIKSQMIDLVLTDLRMPDMDGLTFIHNMQLLTHTPISIMMTAYGSIPTAVEAMKAGAYEYLSKPINLDELEVVVERALKSKQIEVENEHLKKQLDQKFSFNQLIGKSPKILEVVDLVKQVADTRATVLIEGESGTGKELIAKLIHQNSDRKNKPFVAVNCAALSESLLESELFGHAKGSFTGAYEARKGRFEAAHNGTLFLDEIGEINMSMQVKLLRVLQEKSIERVGDNEPIPIDVRIILATNRHLEEMVQKGEFREDLFYRIHVVKINLPNLRQRKDDIPLLINHFMNQFNKEHQKSIESINSDTIEILKNYSWPGNVRELSNVIERMVILSKSKVLKTSDIPKNIFENQSQTSLLSTSSDMSLKELEHARILQTLAQLDNNKTKAAEALGISRRTLHRKLKEYKEE